MKMMRRLITFITTKGNPTEDRKEMKEIHLLPMLCSTIKHSSRVDRLPLTRKGEYKKWAKRAEQNDGKWVHIRSLDSYLYKSELNIADDILGSDHRDSIPQEIVEWLMVMELLAHHVYCLCKSFVEHGFKEATVTIPRSEYKSLKKQ